MRSLLATSFNQNQKNIIVARSTWNPIWRSPLTQAKIWDPFWRPPLTNAEIWDPFWRPPFTKSEIWDPFWRPPFNQNQKTICSSVRLESHLAIPFNQIWNMRSLLATSFNQIQNMRSLLATSFKQNQKNYICSSVKYEILSGDLLWPKLISMSFFLMAGFEPFIFF
jgi:hypothetical protein